MTTHARPRTRARGLLVALGVLALLGAHVVALHQFASRFALPAAIIAGAVLLMVITHLKRFRQFHEAFGRRRSVPDRRSESGCSNLGD